jgi:hypothetical protein
VITYVLTRRADVCLAVKAQELTFTRSACEVCEGPATVWPDRIVCMTHQDGSRCPGNGPLFSGAPR